MDLNKFNTIAARLREAKLEVATIGKMKKNIDSQYEEVNNYYLECSREFYNFIEKEAGIL